MKIWLVYGESESGDTYEPVAFSEKPNDEVLERLAYDWDGDEERGGPGNYGSYVYLTVLEVEVDAELKETDGETA